MQRRQYEKLEASFLAGYAMKCSESAGRKFPEKEHSLRTAYQRDRDRIIYSTAFRRLQYKTQVFVNHEGDHFRTRLTHTLETNQIAKTVARALRLNEDLVEAISLAHDLGHGPFGHAGEWALKDLMKAHGGFEHNVHGLRVVEHLEERYPEFRGLNLTRETLAGLKKHPERFVGDKSKRFHTLEADVVDYADEIAYSSHDLDDGLRAGLLNDEQVENLQIWKSISSEAKRLSRKALPARRKDVYIRLMIDRFVMDLAENTLQRIQKYKLKSIADLQEKGRKLVDFSPEVKKEHAELKRFLYEELYQHHYVVRMTTKGQRFIRSLFEAYLAKPKLLPRDVLQKTSEEGLHRAICDYLAGMTDRFAVEETMKLFEPYEKLA